MTPPYVPEIQEKSQKFPVSFTERGADVLLVFDWGVTSASTPLRQRSATFDLDEGGPVRLMLSFDCGVCTPAVALRLLYSNRGMSCALCGCFFLFFFFLRKTRAEPCSVIVP